jgi:hypothetical protein
VYEHAVTHLERVPLGTSYPDVVARVCAVWAALAAPPILAVDQSGVGRQTVDQFRLAEPRCAELVPVTITPGAGAAAPGRPGLAVVGRADPRGPGGPRRPGGVGWGRANAAGSGRRGEATDGERVCAGVGVGAGRPSPGPR